jgi:aminoglycoside 2'-N-acetyltransferase I
MRILTFPEAEVPPQLRAQVVGLQRQAWPSDEPMRLTHDPVLAPLSMLLIEGEQVLAALDILSKEIVHCGEKYAVSGLSTVVTGESVRQMGNGRHLVEAAHELIANSGADLAVFTCDASLKAFYERAGWQVLEGTVLIGGTAASPFPSDQFEKVTMGSFFTPRAKNHEREFMGSRISLYPGEIDKLW